MSDEHLEPFSKEEQLDLELEMEKIQREHLIKEIIAIRRRVREKLMTHLMELNQMAHQRRADDAELVAAGRMSDSIFDFHDGFIQAIAEVSAYISNIEDSDNEDLSPKALQQLMLTRAAAATEMHVHDGYKVLAAFLDV